MGFFLRSMSIYWFPVDYGYLLVREFLWVFMSVYGVLWVSGYL